MTPAASASATRRSYDAVAGDYARAIGAELADRPLERAVLAVAAEFAGTGLVLDVGCGPGHVGRHLASLGARVVATDLAAAMCAAVGRGEPGLPCFAADMTALPLVAEAVTGVVCFFAVIHLDEAARAVAYAEFARVLAPGGHALIGFHTSDLEHAVGGTSAPSQWWGHDVELTFHFLDPVAELGALRKAGFESVARLDRAPRPDVEHPSERTYLLVRRR